MFAVPGWNITAKSLVQEQVKPVTEKSKPRPPSKYSAAPLERQHVAIVKKRKRHQVPQTQGPDSAWGSLNKPLTAPADTESASSTAKKHKIQSQPSSTESQIPRQSHERSQELRDAAPGVSRRSKLRQPSKEDKWEKTRQKGKESDLVKNAPEGSKVRGHATVTQSLPPIPPAPTNLTPLQAKMRAKLTSARFRHLNETLYTNSSTDALRLFTSSPDLFAEYHAGFSQQVKDSWPQNPVDAYIKTIHLRGSPSSPVKSAAALPRRKPGACTIADLGCGDAPLARGLQTAARTLNLTIHSFDLHAANPHVTVADISALPLRDAEVDVAIFCLSLMGTNWITFVEEAWRILRGDGKGEVWVAEVKSRFGRVSARQRPGTVVENSVGKRRKTPIGRGSRSDQDHTKETPAFLDEEQKREPEDDTDLQPFIDSFHRRGFLLREGSVDKSNRMFVTMVFTKSGVPRVGKWKGMKWDGQQYQRMEDKRGSQLKRSQPSNTSIADNDAADELEEAKLLKPCVYKLR